MVNGPDVRLDLYGEDSTPCGSLALQVVRSGPAKLDVALPTEVLTWRPQDKPSLVRIPVRLTSAGGSMVAIKSIRVSGPALPASQDILALVRTDGGDPSSPWLLSAGVSSVDEINCHLADASEARLGDQQTEISIDIEWRDGRGADQSWQTKSHVVKVKPRTQAGDSFTRKNGLVCVDFGTTQSSAVLLRGDEDSLEGRVIELGIAGIPGVLEGRLFEDTVVAISSTGELSFGRQARRLAKLEPDAHHIVEDIKWKLSVPDEIVEFNGHRFTNRRLVAGFLAHVKSRIEAHPAFGDQLTQAVMTCPAEFESGQTETLASLFEEVGITPRKVHFSGNDSFVSESWPPIVWALSARSNEDDGGLLHERVAQKRVPYGGLSLFSYTEGSGARTIARPQDFEVCPEETIDEGPIDGTSFEEAPHASWVLTFDMGGGSTDLSAIRITRRAAASEGDAHSVAIMEVSDQTRATSARGIVGRAGFVGREFEELAIQTLAARLDNATSQQPIASGSVEALLSCLSQRSNNLLWNINTATTQGEHALIGIARHNFSVLSAFAEIMRRDDGPFDTASVLFLERSYASILKKADLAPGMSRMIEFAQEFTDNISSDGGFNLRDRILRQPKLLKIDLRGADGRLVTRTLDDDWWIETFVLLATRMFETRFEEEVDRLLKRALLPAMRASSPALVISGRAGLFAPARAFAIAKFKHALGQENLNILALESDDAKLVTALGAAYMGKVFEDLSGHPVRFEVNQNTRLQFRSGIIRTLDNIQIGGTQYGVHAAGLTGQGYKLEALGRDQRARSIAKLRRPDGLADNQWIVWVRSGPWAVQEARIVDALNAQQAAELVAGNSGVIVWSPSETN
jgi:hypothetical protein